MGICIWDGKELTLIDFGCSYGAEFWKNIERETFIETSRHAKSLCLEIPQKLMLSAIKYDWEFYSYHEEFFLNNCVNRLLDVESENRNITELRHLVNSL
nr:hypothetical protein Clen_367 [Cedratvirus lena]